MKETKDCRENDRDRQVQGRADPVDSSSRRTDRATRFIAASPLRSQFDRHRSRPVPGGEPGHDMSRRFHFASASILLTSGARHP